MDITFDARMVFNSGIGTYIRNVLDQLVAQKHDITLFCHREQVGFNKDIAADKYRINDARIYTLAELVKNNKMTKGSRLFWTPHYNVPLFSAAKINIVTIHDVFHLEYARHLSLKQQLYARFMINRAVQSDLIFTVSEFSKAEIIKHTGCKPDKIKVVYNGVDAERFGRKTNTPAQITFPYILFVGNVKFYKNLKNALLAFKELLQSHPAQFNEYRFVIVGKRSGFIIGDDVVTGLLEDPLLKSHVVFTEWVTDDELVAYYQHAQCLVFPSLYEGFGLPPLEAMAAEIPVLASDFGPMKEVCGKAALYFNPLDINEISDAYYRILTDKTLASGLVKNGKEQILKFNWKNAVAQKIAYISALT